MTIHPSPGTVRCLPKALSILAWPSGPPAISVTISVARWPSGATSNVPSSARRAAYRVAPDMALSMYLAAKRTSGTALYIFQARVCQELSGAPLPRVTLRST